MPGEQLRQGHQVHGGRRIRRLRSSRSRTCSSDEGGEASQTPQASRARSTADRSRLLPAFLAALTAASASAAPRLYVGLEVPPDLRRKVTEIQAAFRRRGVRARWSPGPGLHLTLKFLGEVPDWRRGKLDRILHGVARRHRPFSLRYRGVSTFPFRHSPSPRVIWAAPAEGSEHLEALGGELRSILKPPDWRGDDYPFRPHVTVARRRDPGASPALAEALRRLRDEELATHTVGEFVLFRSVPGADRDLVVGRYSLGEGAEGPLTPAERRVTSPDGSEAPPSGGARPGGR